MNPCVTGSIPTPCANEKPARGEARAACSAPLEPSAMNVFKAAQHFLNLHEEIDPHNQLVDAQVEPRGMWRFGTVYLAVSSYSRSHHMRLADRFSRLKSLRWVKDRFSPHRIHAHTTLCRDHREAKTVKRTLFHERKFLAQNSRDLENRSPICAALRRGSTEFR